VRTVRLRVDDEAIEYEVDADTVYGGETILLDGDDDLIAGTAFAEAGDETLRDLYGRLPFFRTIVDNLEMTLAKSSLPISRGYLPLVGDDSLFAAIEEEHTRAVSGVLAATGVTRMLERQPVLRRSIELRNPYVDPMNAVQVELLRRFRHGDDDARVPLLRSIAAIAAALRNTG